MPGADLDAQLSGPAGWRCAPACRRAAAPPGERLAAPIAARAARQRALADDASVGVVHPHVELRARDADAARA